MRVLRRHNVTSPRLFAPGELIPRGIPPAPAVLPWDAFTTHAQINDWVQHWQEDHALVLPAGWSGWTLTQKRQWLNANVTL